VVVVQGQTFIALHLGTETMAAAMVEQQLEATQL
jgi:hypothetical protein